MNITNKYSATILVSLALATWSLCFQSSCRGAEQTPVNLAERIRVLGAEDLGLLPIDQARPFASCVLTEASSAGLAVMSMSRVTSRTNGSFIKLGQTLALEATERQLVDFLGTVAASKSALRVQSLSLRPTPDRSRLRASMAIIGDYRLPASGQSQEPTAAQIEDLVLSQRRHLRRAALDCYNLTKSTLPPGCELDSLGFQDGKRLSVQGEAPADQVSLLLDVRTRFEKAKAQDGKALFLPSSGEGPVWRVAAGRTNADWSMQFELRPPESR
jgi:hypothetical protein